MAVRQAVPYVEQFSDWQRWAAFIRSTLLTKATAAEEKSEQITALRTLIAEVE